MKVGVCHEGKVAFHVSRPGIAHDMGGVSASPRLNILLFEALRELSIITTWWSPDNSEKAHSRT